MSRLRPVWPPCRCYHRDFPEWRPDCEERWCHVRWWVGMGVPSLAIIVGLFVTAGTTFANGDPCSSPGDSERVVITSC